MKAYHSVFLDKDKCKGCINCMKHCPTEAIRVRKGKATIISERCIDCGECIKVCSQQAKRASSDPFEIIENFKYKIALPAPSLYAQFHKLPSIDTLLTALLKIGFDDIYEVALAAQTISEHTRELMKREDIKKPVISSACPAVLKLIQIRFPSLIDHVVPVMAPVELAARRAKDEAMAKTGLDAKDIGVFFISPCAAKITMSKDPIGFDAPLIDGILSMNEVYKRLLTAVPQVTDPLPLAKASGSGIGWASSGGESAAVDSDRNISVDGVDNIIKVLEKIEDGALNKMEFIELNACTVGCLGGCLTVEDPYVARARLGRLLSHLKKEGRIEEEQKPAPEHEEESLMWHNPLENRPGITLDDDMEIALEKMRLMEKITEELPGLDCGSCGAPSCRALAEDIVLGYASADDCIFKIRERIAHLFREVMRLQDYLPPPFRDAETEDGKGEKK